MLEAEASRNAQAPAKNPNAFTSGYSDWMKTNYATSAEKITTVRDEVPSPKIRVNSLGVEEQSPALVPGWDKTTSRISIQPPSRSHMFGSQSMKSLSASALYCVKTEKIKLVHPAGHYCRAVYNKQGTNSVITPLGVYYPPLQSKSDLPREVYKWLQSLDLSVEYTNLRRDFANGYLVAEIFSRYFVEANIRLVTNGTSLIRKMNNWFHLDNFFKRNKLKIPKHLIHGTIHRWPGAAELIIQHIYNKLTNRKAKLIVDDEVDFMDTTYQDKLPHVAKSTAAHAIRSNLRSTEMAQLSDQFKVQQRILNIINIHMQRRQTDKITESERFHKKPSLGELAVRLALPVHQYEDMTSKNVQKSELNLGTEMHIPEIRSKTSVLFKNVYVKQIVTNSIPNKTGNI